MFQCDRGYSMVEGPSGATCIAGAQIYTNIYYTSILDRGVVTSSTDPVCGRQPPKGALGKISHVVATPSTETADIQE